MVVCWHLSLNTLKNTNKYQQMKRKLTEIAIKNAKPNSGKPARIADGGGLYLHVTSTSKAWRYNFRYQQKQKTLSFGLYPEISLAEARELHNEAKAKLARGIYPSKKEIKKSSVTFEQVANEWFDMINEDWSDTHRNRSRRLLDQYILPWIGKEAISLIEPPDVLHVLKKMEKQGIISSMHKAKILCGQIFRYGVARGFCIRDQTADLRGALKTEKPVHFASITDPQEIKQLMKDISSYSGNYLTREGLKLQAYTFVRSGELRLAKRSEFDLEAKVWSIPKERMKNRKPHFVPLSDCVVEIIKGLLNNYHSEYLLPAIHTNKKPMSENTLNVALRRMGYDKNTMTSHGFRSMASTRLNEMGYNPDAIEAQLSHVEGNAVRAAYNRGKYWDERVKMMGEWSDYLVLT